MSDATAPALRKAAIVTGASEGIGAELARVFAARGHEVALVARRGDLLEALALEIAASGAAKKPIVVELDLLGDGAVDRLEQALAQAGVAPEFLVNNAGFGLMGRAVDLDADEQLAMIDLNVRTLTALTLRFLEPIIAARGGVLNVASIASFMPGPGFAVYYATKAYVRSFSEGLAEELRPLGVKVSALCPGPVPTGFQSRAGFDFSGGMKALTPAILPASEVAAAGYEALMQGRRVVVPGFVNKVVALTSILAPRAILLPLLARMQRTRR